MDQAFIKHFTNGYWLSREESILSYLHQRNAAVPKVQYKDTIKNELALENIGSSLSQLFSKKCNEDLNLINILSLTANTIKSLENIFNLGVLHLDIALRNVGAKDINADQVCILDFSHSISQHNLLQKPLNLIPTTRLHHPELFDALTIDWQNYCNFFGIHNPKLDINFAISDDDFLKYWPESLEVQSIVSRKCILCHGIGNLLLELCEKIEANHPCHSLFYNSGKSLLNLSESVADYQLANTIKLIEDELDTTRFIALEKTPIPQSSQKPIGIKSVKPLTTNPSFIKSILKTKILNYLSTNPLKNRAPCFAELLTWFFITTNLVWINLLIDTAKIHISEIAINMIIACAFFTLFFLVLSFFSKKAKQSHKLIAVVFASVLEIIPLFEYSNTIIAHFWLWLPSTLVAFYILLRSLIDLKKRIYLLGDSTNR